jgi:UDP-N-acetylmuramate dehydrogenase
VDQIQRVVAFTHRQQIPLVVIGQGSNLLFADAGLRGGVLKLGSNFARLQSEGPRLRAEAGVWVPQLARLAARAGLSGLEHTIGIPGTVGGLVLMNGGSQRQAIGSCVRRVEVLERDGTAASLLPEECHFAYRHSALQARGVIVLGVELEGQPGERRRIVEVMLQDLRERRRKCPRKEPNCGSVFLSTGDRHASVGPPGKIIEEAGLKGVRIGGAEVSRRHANFIVNRGGARAAEVLALIARIRREIADRIGFDLRCEVRYVSAAGEIAPAHLAADLEDIGRRRPLDR